jgi:hypothetical protein
MSSTPTLKSILSTIAAASLSFACGGELGDEDAQAGFSAAEDDVTIYRMSLEDGDAVTRIFRMAREDFDAMEADLDDPTTATESYEGTPGRYQFVELLPEDPDEPHYAGESIDPRAIAGTSRLSYISSHAPPCTSSDLRVYSDIFGGGVVACFYGTGVGSLGFFAGSVKSYRAGQYAGRFMTSTSLGGGDYRCSKLAREFAAGQLLFNADADEQAANFVQRGTAPVCPRISASPGPSNLMISGTRFSPGRWASAKITYQGGTVLQLSPKLVASDGTVSWSVSRCGGNLYGPHNALAWDSWDIAPGFGKLFTFSSSFYSGCPNQ